MIYTHAGPEIGVASTKTFTATLTALYLLALHLGRVRGARRRPTRAGGDSAGAAGGAAPGRGRARPRRGDRRAGPAPLQRRDFLYLGRGLNYPIALEGALKLKELSYIHAEGYAGGEMKHGPIALIDEDMPVVALVPQRRDLRQDAGQHRGGPGARRPGHRGRPRGRRDDSREGGPRARRCPPDGGAPDAAAPRDPAPALRVSRRRSGAAATWTSRGTWPRASPSSSPGLSTGRSRGSTGAQRL